MAILTKFGDNRMNLRILVLKTDKVSSFLRSGSNLFHSMIVDGNKFLKKVVVCIKKGNISCAFLVEYNVRLTGIKLKKYLSTTYV